jgi:hypothetical protein
MANMPAESGDPSPINRADSLTIFGIVITILLYALFPSFLVRALCVILGTGLLVSLILGSDYLTLLKPRIKGALAVLAVIIVAFVAIPQLMNEWRESHKPQELAASTPSIVWDDPKPITFGTPLSATQLNARASVDGEFTYNPTGGTTLTAGTNTLQVTFAPKDTKKYTQATKTVAITVLPPIMAKPVVKNGPPLTIASHEFKITNTIPAEAVLNVYINNNTGALLKVKRRTLGTIYLGGMRQEQREEFEKSGWEQMSKRVPQDTEFSLEPDSYVSIGIPLPPETENLLREGTARAAFFIDIKDSSDKKSLVQLCGFANGSGELIHCATHNLP